MKSMTPNDLGKILLTDECSVLSVNDFVRTATKELKKELLEAELQLNGLNIALTTSNTGYGGSKFWWLCPACNKRCGVLYRHPVSQIIACRVCLGIKYRSSAKKGMIENNLK